MKTIHISMATIVTLLASLLPQEASAAGVTVFFNPSQVATLLGTGTTTDTISCEGYIFIYTRDKLFTGGGSEPIGRNVRIPWPQGVEAQYVTAGPNPEKARITVRRVDGGVFDLESFTAKLLANAGAGRAIEIIPFLGGEEPFNDPFYFDVSGYYGQNFSYDTSPNYLGTTAPLVNFDAYDITLTLDYALIALTLRDTITTSAVGEPPMPPAGNLLLSPNPAGSRVQISLSGDQSVAGERLSIFSARGARVRSLMLDTAGRATWDLCDDNGGPVAAGVYFVRAESASRSSGLQRLVVVR